MIRLSETLARRRMLYPRPIATLPDILVVDVPAPFAHPSLSLGRFYGIMIESSAEYDEFEAFLVTARPALVPPDLLDRRPSALITARIAMIEYVPPIPDWPWVLLCHWPATYAGVVPAEKDMFARGAYTVEMFETEQKLADAATVLLATLGRTADIAVHMISGDGPVAVGHA